LYSVAPVNHESPKNGFHDLGIHTTTSSKKGQALFEKFFRSKKIFLKIYNFKDFSQYKNIFNWELLFVSKSSKMTFIIWTFILPQMGKILDE